MKDTAKILSLFLVLIAGNIFSLYPFSLNLRDTSPDNPDDVLLNSFIMQWEYERIINLDLENYFDTPYFYPYKNTLAYTEHHSISQIFFFPLFTIFKDAVFVHNLMVLILLILAGFTMYLFVNRITGSYIASVIAAVAFSFVPYRYTHLVHMNLLHWWIIPLCFISAYNFAERLSLKNALFMGVSLLSLSLWSNNITAFFVVPFSIYFFYLIQKNRLWNNRNFYILFLIIVVTDLILVYPFLRHYLRLRDEMFFERFLFDIKYYSPHIRNFLGVHKSNIVWGDLLGKNGEWERYLFPQATFLFLFCLGIFTIYFSRFRKLGILFTLIALLSFLLSLGPYILDLGESTRGPYYILLKYLPGYYGIRVPTRFAIFMYFSMAVVTALFVANIERMALHRRFLRTTLRLGGLIAVALLIFEGSHRIDIKIPLNHPERDPVYVRLKELPYGVFFEFPAWMAYKDAAQTYASLYVAKPTVNGYSGWKSKPLENLLSGVKNYSPNYIIKAMRNLNVRYFILRGISPPYIYERLRRLDEYDTTIRKVFQNKGDIIFEIDDSSLSIVDFSTLDLRGANFYLPSCIRPRERINGGIVLKLDDRFYFSPRRRYSERLQIIDNYGNIRTQRVDIIAYRVYEEGYIHLLIKANLDLPQGIYTLKMRDMVIKERVNIDSGCSLKPSDSIEIGGMDLTEDINYGEPLNLVFNLKNRRDYLISAVDIDDFTTDGVVRVGIFIQGIDNGIAYEQRYPIYSDMSADDEIRFSQKIPLYLPEGRYRFRLDFVSEKRFWFSQKGFGVIEKEVSVKRYDE